MKKEHFNKLAISSAAVVVFLLCIPLMQTCSLKINDRRLAARERKLEFM